MIYVETNSIIGSENLAFEEYFLKKEDIREPVLMLWRNRPTIVVGAFQNTHEEICEEFVKANKIDVVRRTSGGGAVYHDLGNLCFSFIMEHGDFTNTDYSAFLKPVVEALRGMGIQPDIIVCRSEHPLDNGIKDKISLFCNLPADHVLQNLDVDYLYEAPLAMEKEHLAQVVCECLHLDCPKPDLSDWETMVDNLRHPVSKVRIALVGKYVQLHDAYISVVEALKHGGIYSHTTVEIKWVDAETVTPETADEIFKDVTGILVPGGFGHRGVEGKIEAIRYARTHKIPFLGICLGMQLAIVEFARNVIGFHDAHSLELNPSTTHPVIHIMQDQIGIEDIGGTLRLGAYPCILDKTSKAYEVYQKEEIQERHRHRYEVNNDYREVLTENGMNLCGLSPDGKIVEMAEIKDHPWFIATQAHPELKSRPNKPHPLFKGFVEAAAALDKH